MGIGKFLRPNYPDLLILLAGVTIGYSPMLSVTIQKIGCLILAIAFILLAKYLRRKGVEK